MSLERVYQDLALCDNTEQAGGAGLSLSLLLHQQGIASLLIERRIDTSWYPRARSLNFRTLEVLRGLGLEAEVLAGGAPISRMFRKHNLAASEQEEIPNPIAVVEHLEATTQEPFAWYYPQSKLEPLLLAEAKRCSADVRYGTEFVSFTQDETGVTAAINDRATGKESEVRAEPGLETGCGHPWTGDTRVVATYQTERHPVGLLAAQQSMVVSGAILFGKEITEAKGSALPDLQEQLSLMYPSVGYRYRSEAILSEEATTPAQDGIESLKPLELHGLPGTRVPHLWVEREGQRLSTLDLLDGRFVLFAGPAGAPWQKAASEVAGSLGIKLAAYGVGSDGDLLDLENSWQTKMGVSAEGVVLVRPDDFVAWRSNTLPTNPVQQLKRVFAHILCQPFSK